MSLRYGELDLLQLRAVLQAIGDRSLGARGGHPRYISDLGGGRRPVERVQANPRSGALTPLRTGKREMNDGPAGISRNKVTVISELIAGQRVGS